jgi:3-hydroxymyristoyl/3-hydroxydecanoyl-(acyl carrier protein) dehydratase
MASPDGMMKIPDDLDVFQGHFPSHPILPGIYSIQVALYYLELNLRRRVKLHAIQRCKFNRPLGPGMTIRVESELGARTGNMQSASVFLRSQDNSHVISEVHFVVELVHE